MPTTRLIVELEVKPGAYRRVHPRGNPSGRYRDTKRGLKAAFKARSRARARELKRARVKGAQPRDVRIMRVTLNRFGRIQWKGRLGVKPPERIEYPFQPSRKDSANRRAVYREADRRGIPWTSGDRTPEEQAALGSIPNSNHVTTYTTTWADDYALASWVPRSGSRMQAFHEWCVDHHDHLNLLDLPPVNHGTGPHVHVGGRVV
jgi:hypothetical protein